MSDAFDYTAVDADGTMRKGTLEAATAADVVRTLTAQGQTALSITEHRPAELPSLKRRLKLGDVVVAFHELATLLSAGVALSDAVLAQSRGIAHPALAEAFDAIAKELLRGASFLVAARASHLPLPD